MIPKARTSLYKARIYLTTANGNTFLWNLGTNWSSPVDANLIPVMSNLGYAIDAATTDKEKHYWFTDLYKRTTESSADITDGSGVAVGDQFTITIPAGGATGGGWVASKVYTITLDATTVAYAQALDFDGLVNSLNNLLAYAPATAALNAGRLFEFYRFDKAKIGFKTKPLYTSVTTGDYNFTLADVSGAFIITDMKLSGALIQNVSAKIVADYSAAVTAVASDVNLVVETRGQGAAAQPSYQKVFIKKENISELFMNVLRVEETFTPHI
jgi:hypothetical protein